MPDIVVTPANVMRSSGASLLTGTAGEAISAGHVVARDQTGSGKYMLASASASDADLREPEGIALNNAAAGQPFAFADSGTLTLGAGLTAGIAYYLSATPGGICARADLAVGAYVCLLGLASSATVIDLGIQPSGVQAA